jgi:hypothetical protein
LLAVFEAVKWCKQDVWTAVSWWKKMMWGGKMGEDIIISILFVGSGFETWRNRYKHKAWGSSMELLSGFVCKKLGTYALCLSTRVASGIFRRKPTCCFDTWSQEREKESSSSQGTSPVSMKQTPLETLFVIAMAKRKRSLRISPREKDGWKIGLVGVA